MSTKKRRRAYRKPVYGAVIATPFSANRKTGPVAATYAAQGSCPVTCPLRGAGCYAEDGNAAIITRGINTASVGMTPDEIATAEADAIDGLTSRGDLRLHVVGDCRTNHGAATVATAVGRYLDRARCDAEAWTYTHAFLTVERANWGPVSVLASCHSFHEAEIAMAHGYAACVIVDRFTTESWWTEDTPAGRIKVVACPYQTKGVQCIKCRLCMDADRLLESRNVIAFEAHGNRRASVIRSLPVI